MSINEAIPHKIHILILNKFKTSKEMQPLKLILVSDRNLNGGFDSLHSYSDFDEMKLIFKYSN